MIVVERSGGRLRLRACRSGENSTAVDWHALLKTSAEIEPRFVRHLKSAMTQPRYQCVVASGGGSFVAARRCAFSFPKRAHDLGPNIGPKLLSTGCHGEIEDALPKLEKSPKMLTE
jgi:hypothetical protein